MSSTNVLTAGQDTVLALDGDQTVQAIAATLNAGTYSFNPTTGTATYTGGDQLDGGAGYDVLALTGPGSFDLANLAQFTGFEEVHLTNVTSSSASLTLRDGVDLKVTLSDGTTTPGGSTAFPTAGGFSVTLSTGRVTLQGGSGSDQIYVNGSTKLQAGSVIDGGAGYDTLNLSAPYNYNPTTGASPSVDTTYDLTGISLNHVENLNVSGSIMGVGKTIVKVDAASLADVTSISLGYNGTLATTATALDLTSKIVSSGLYPSVSTGTITSLNTTGTSFTVGSYQTALQIVGGTGQDAIILKGTTLTSAQRDQLFASSIETVTDASGTYTKPPLPAGTTLLTMGADVVLLSAGDQTVQATSATLNVGSSVYSPATGSYTYTGGDQLDGGAGYDVLALTGPGSFDLANLAQFTGFEEVRLTNATSSYASLTLRDGVDLKVTLSDGTTTPGGSTAFPAAGGFSVTLGTGRVTLQGGSGSDQIYVNGSTKLQAGSVIDGGAAYDTLSLSAPYIYNPATGMSSSVDTTYDLTGISLSHVESLSVSGSTMGTGKTIVKVDAAALADVTSISLGYNGTLATTDTALDLTGKIASSGLYPSPGIGIGTITSLNTTGTSFTVDSYQTALQIVGGTGQDTVILKGTTLTSAQREQLFASSIETITDTSGTYTKAGPVDVTSPVLTLSINDGQLLAGESGIVTFQFSEVVTGFALSDVTATHGQLSGLTMINPLKYTAVFTPDTNYTGTGEISVAAGLYADTAGNAGSGSRVSTAIDTIDRGATLLTTGTDVVLLSAGDQTVQATSATLNADTYVYNGTTSAFMGGDQLDGGAGYDVLALTGPGSFNLADLAQFTGFEEVRLTNVTSSSASLTLRNGVDLKVTLSDGTTTTPGGSTALPTAGGFSVTLGTGRVTLQGGNENDQISASAPTKLQAGSVIDGGAGYDTLSLSAPYNYNPAAGMSSSVDTTYDLTGISLSHVESLSVSGSTMGTGKTIVKVDAAALADVTSISLGYNGTLATTAAALDLTGKIASSGLYPSPGTGVGTITSLNTTGTNFTVDSYQTALQIVGGTGQDTVILKGTTLTSAQRDQLFTSSVETVTDASGTYTKAPLPAGTTLLTMGADVVLLSAGDQTVQATAATLNVGSSVYSPATGSYTYTGGDQLDGGAGYDVLALTGPGSFDLARLTQFTGFEEVRLTNATSSYASLTLRDGVDLKVILSDGTTTTPGGSTAFPTAGGFSVTLGTGRVTLQGGSGSDQIYVNGSTKLQAGSVIDGGAGYDTLSLSAPYNYNPATGMSSSVDTTYDLTGISLSHVESLNVSGVMTGAGKTIVKVDAATLTDVTSISLGYNGTLATTAAALDLTGKIVSSGLNSSPSTGTITSLNTTGTSFTVGSYQTALQIVGGTGQDTVILKGTTLTSAQREQLFASSIETITDTSGTYTKAGPVDVTSPVLTLSINDGQLLAGESGIVTFQFSEVVTGFALSDVTATHGQLSGLTMINPLKYTAVFTPDTNYTGTGEISVAAGLYADTAGNAGSGSRVSTAIDTIDRGATLLTTGTDVVLLSAGDQTVQATSATLNADTYVYNGTTSAFTGGDQLDGGAGYDVLALTGPGSFDLAGLAQFTGFEEVRLTNVTSSSASLTLRDGLDLKVILSDGTTTTPGGSTAFPTAGGFSVALGTGRVTLQGGNGSDQISASGSTKLQAGSVIDGGAGYDTLSLSALYNINPTTGASPSADTLYDLTSISLSHVESLSVSGGMTGAGKIIVKVDAATLADVNSINLFGSGSIVELVADSLGSVRSINLSGSNTSLTTTAASFDLTSKSIYGSLGAIRSSNAAGTTFTVDSAATAYLVQGGAGQDTVVVKGQTLTAAQRDQIFTGSVEVLTDASGSYSKPPVPAGTTLLTTGPNVVLLSDGDQTVQATAATLNAGTYNSYNPTTGTSTYTGGDQLDGGAGYDVLALTGPGSFDLANLAQFTGFEEVRLTNVTSSYASLTLRDGVDLKITLSDGTTTPGGSTAFPTAGGFSVTLGTGRVTLQGGSGSDQIYVNGSTKLQAGSVIDGGAGYDTLSLSAPYNYNPTTGASPSVDTTYDLTGISLSHVENLNVSGVMTGAGKTIVKVDAATLADVTSITLGYNGTLATTAAALDLTGKSVSSGLYPSGSTGTITSLNSTGTTFTVSSYQTALQIVGGTGQDAVILKGTTLSSAQREQLFASAIETITDTSGTYTKAGPVDVTSPVLTLSINDGQLLAGESGIVTFQFSEVVTGFAFSDVTATHGQLSGLTMIDPLKYTAMFTPDANYTGTGEISVVAGLYADTAGNAGSGSRVSTAIDTIDRGATLLTTGTDVVLLSAGDQIVQATAATLNADIYNSYNPTTGTSIYTGGDKLDGGAGYDVLTLTGPGSFDLARLAQFTGFEEVRLTNVTSSYASLTLRDGADLKVTLSDGTTTTPGGSTAFPSASGFSVTLGTGRVTLQGGNESDQISASAPTKLQAGSVIDGGAGYDTLSLSTPYNSGSTPGAFPSVDTVYDLTSISLSHVESLNVSGGITGAGKTIVKVDAATLADVTSINLTSYTSGVELVADSLGSVRSINLNGSNTSLTTTAASFDLTSKSIYGSIGTIKSSNAAGTTFTVDSAATAYLVQGGAGQDTVVVKGQTLTAAQRDQIFTGSVETVTDASGTYTKPVVPAGTTLLTTGTDVVLLSAGDQTVQATATTLNASTYVYSGMTSTYTGGDQLDGGAGYDVLALTGPGSFDLAGLAQFTGFEEVRLTNVTSSYASLTLRDGVDLKVTLSDGTTTTPGGSTAFPSASGFSVTLGTGRVTLQGGNESDQISASAPTKLQAGSVIDGGAGYDTLSLSTPYNSGSTPGAFPSVDTVYDLTSISLSHVESLNVSGGITGAGKTIVKVDAATLADVTSINLTSYTSGVELVADSLGSVRSINLNGSNTSLTTTAASFDLTSKSIYGSIGTIKSSNAAGTTFTVDSAATAYLVQGGAGQDTVVVKGQTLTAAQRDQIFTGSVETVTDASGTYTKPVVPAGTTLLTTGTDVVLLSAGDQTVQATATTLNASTYVYSGMTSTYTGGDQLDGGAGYDVLALTGPGSFDLAGLAQFTGFEEVRLTNVTSSYASLTLRDGADLKVTLSDGTTTTPGGSTAFPSASGFSVTLGTGRVTLQGGNESDQISASAPTKLQAGSVIDGGAGYDTLSLSTPYNSGSTPGAFPSVDTVYDLTSISLSHVESLNVSGGITGAGKTIVKVDAATLADVTSINLTSYTSGVELVADSLGSVRSINLNGSNTSLTTTAVSFDLTSKSIYGSIGTIKSSNAAGTTFTVDSAATAYLVQGGAGQDTVVVKGQTLTAAQRDQIFTGSVETVTDASGTYSKFGSGTGNVPPRGAPNTTISRVDLDGSHIVAKYDANGILGNVRKSHLDGSSEAQAYTAGLLTREVVTYAPGGTEISNTKVFNAAGLLTSETQLHTDLTKDVFLSNLTGRSYVAEHASYNTAGLLVEATRTHTDGSLDYHYVRSSDGTKTTDQFDAGGILKSHVVLSTDGSSEAQAYTAGLLTREVVTYAPGGTEISNTKVFNAAGLLTSETQLHADLTKDVFLSNLTGRSYVAEHASYNTAGLLVEATRTHTDGSLDSHYVRSSDGTKTTEQFDASGMLKSHVVLSTDGSSEAQAYTAGQLTREVVIYAPGGTEISNTKVFNAAGLLTSETQLHADLTKDVFLSNLTGRSYAAEHASYNTAGLLVEATRTHTDGSLDYHYVRSSDGTKTTEQFDASGILKSHVVLSTDGSSEAQAYTGGLLTREVVTYAPGGMEISNTKVFNATGLLTSETQLHADLTKDVFLSNLTGRSYVAEHASYNTTGLLVEATRTHTDGSLDYHYVRSSDGTKTTEQFDASGILKSHVVLSTDGSSEAQAYTAGQLTREVVIYAPGGTEISNTKVFNAAGLLTSETQLHADLTKDVFLSNLTGRSYVAEHNSYDGNGELVFADQTNLDGSHVQTAYQVGQTLVSTAGVADTFKSYAADTFVFMSGFGKDTVTKFHAGSSNGHDTLWLDSAQVSNFAEIQSHMTAIGSDTLVSLSPADSILLKNVQITSLKLENFHFIDHGLFHV